LDKHITDVIEVAVVEVAVAEAVGAADAIVAVADGIDSKTFYQTERRIYHV